MRRNAVVSPDVDSSGKENPSRRLKIAVGSLLISLILILYGIWTDFVPSIEWAHWGFYCSIAIACALTVHLYWAIGAGHMKLKKNASDARIIFSMLAMPFLLFLASEAVTMSALPDIVTIAIGDDHKELFSLKKDKWSGTRSCTYRLRGDALDRMYQSHVCISKAAYASLPAQPTPIILEGKSSWLGFHIRNVKHEQWQITAETQRT